MSLMSHASRFLRTTVMVAIGLSGSIAFAQERRAVGPPDLEPEDDRSCVFADHDARFRYRSTVTPRGAAGQIGWNVHWALVAEGRTLARGRSDVLVSADGDVPYYVVAVPMPPLREGVVMNVELQTTWTADRRVYKHNRPLYIYPRDPFAARKAFLQRARIQLFDPVGKTAELLDAHEIPHKRLMNLAAIDRVIAGLVLVGEGVSFRRQRKLAESLIQAAHRGVSVLCLAPSEGDFPLRIDDRRQQFQPTRLVLERDDVVRRYDKRFDLIASQSQLRLEPRRNEVMIIATKNNGDWSWLSMEFPAQEPNGSPGRLIVCSLSIVGHWDVSPVPRYLFTHLLQELTDGSSTKEKQNDLATNQ